jgi:hypothetical protein
LVGRWWEDGKMGRWEDGKMGRWEDGKMGRWEDGKKKIREIEYDVDVLAVKFKGGRRHRVFY